MTNRGAPDPNLPENDVLDALDNEDIVVESNNLLPGLQSINPHLEPPIEHK